MISLRSVSAALVAGALAVVPALAGTAAQGYERGRAVAMGGAATTMVVEPTTLKPGDSFTISNDPSSPCFGTVVTGDTGGMIPHAWTAPLDASGNWSITLQVPTEGPPDASGNPTPFPPGEYEIHAFCEAEGEPGDVGAQQEVIFSYTPVTVTVVAAAPPTPDAPPASEALVIASPRFTG